MVIYLAGKVGGQKHELAKGHVGVQFICSDGGNHSEHNFGLSYYSFEECGHGSTLRDLVHASAISALHECDFLFAWLSCATSYGSIAEIAYASALGKKCYVMIQNDPECNKASESDDLFDAYYFVCCFPNVMVQEVLTLMEARQILDAIISAQRQRETASSAHQKRMEMGGPTRLA